MSAWGVLISFTVHKDINLDGERVWLGRGDSCHPESRYTVPSISKQHCLLQLTGRIVTVTDTSSNGTYVNGVAIGRGSTVELHHEDVLSLVVPDAASDAFNPEESVMYRFHSLLAPPSSAAPAVASSASSATSSSSSTPIVSAISSAPVAKKTAVASRPPNGLGAVVAAAAAAAAAASAASSAPPPETSAPEDFVRAMKVDASAAVLRALHVALKTRKDSWLRLFIEIGGLDQLSDVLSVKSRSTDASANDETSVGAVWTVKCIKVLVNERFGLRAALETDGFVKTLALCSDSTEAKVRAKLPKILAAICCSSPEGHAQVLAAMEMVRSRRRDQQRFKWLVKALGFEEDCRLKADILTLINVIVNFPSELATRVALREEFIALGIVDVLQGLDLVDSPALNQQLTLFRDEMEEDTAEMKVKAPAAVRADPVDLAKDLKAKFEGTPAMSQLNKLLQDLLAIPKDGSSNVPADVMIAEMLRKSAQTIAPAGPVASSKSTGVAAPSNAVAAPAAAAAVAVAAAVDNQRVLELENQLKKSELRIMQLEREYRGEVEKMRLEKDAEIRKLRARVDERLPGSPFSPVLQAMDAAAAAANHATTTPMKSSPAGGVGKVAAAAREMAAKRITSPVSSLPSSEQASASFAPPPPPPPMPKMASIPSAPLPAPITSEHGASSTSGSGAAGAPPPPPPLLSAATVSAVAVGASVPRIKMKKLHWAKIPQNRISGTVWQTMNWANIKLDVGEMESLFAAPRDKEEGSKLRLNADQNVDKVRFFDSKRANNIGIMMSQFRGVGVQGLVKSLREGDENILTLERVAQLYKFCPTPDEEKLLTSYDGPVENLGKVEQFFLQLLTVPRLRNRLEALEFKLRFDDAVCSVFTRLDAVSAACREIGSSASLQRVVELVLAMGNFMNHGPSAAPSLGFDITFLGKLADTKSVNDKTTFLHYLALVMERSGITKLCEELQSIEAAAQVSVEATMSELAALREGLALIQKEEALARQESEEDSFAASLKDFHDAAADVLQRCSDVAQTVRTMFVTVQTRFGLAPSTTLEEVLAVLSNFLLGVEKCRKDNARDERMRELAEKKRAPRPGPSSRRPTRDNVQQAAEAATLRFSLAASAASDDATIDMFGASRSTALAAADDAEATLALPLSKENVTSEGPARKGDVMDDVSIYKSLARRRKSAEHQAAHPRMTLREISAAQQLKKAVSSLK